ncbi:MAG TPA: hypothetical protein QF564_08830 [Pirellulaceae bacterium]|jgi:hypothetical protein|nr:hypothetical protein [Pirellulaceae bacterium]
MAFFVRASPRGKGLWRHIPHRKIVCFQAEIPRLGPEQLVILLGQLVASLGISTR